MALVLATDCTVSSPPSQPLDDERTLAAHAEEYARELVRFYPTKSVDGDDGSLGSFDRREILDRLMWLKDFRQKLLGIDTMRLSSRGYDDALWLTSAVKAEIHELEDLATWRRSPGFYLTPLREGIASVLLRENVAGPELALVSARLRSVPDLFETARENLEDVPRRHVQSGIEHLQDTHDWLLGLSTSLDGQFASGELGELGEASRDAARSVRRFVQYLQAELLPRASSEFAWGSEALERTLRYREMLGLSLDGLARLAEDRLRETRARMDVMLDELSAEALAARLSELRAESTPAMADPLLQAREILVSVRPFVSDPLAVRFLSVRPVRMAQMPPFLSGGILPRSRWDATMDSGLFLVPPLSGAGLAAGPEARGNGWALDALRLSIYREIYPGKLLLEWYRREYARGVGRFLRCPSAEEGWGLYVEQAVLDGIHDGDRPGIRLTQLHHLLLELSRVIVSVELHSERMTPSEAETFFVSQALVEPPFAAAEVRKLAVDPLRLVPGLGTILLTRLRDDYLRERGDEASLEEFHTGYLALGAPPLYLARRSLLSPGSLSKLEGR